MLTPKIPTVLTQIPSFFPKIPIFSTKNHSSQADSWCPSFENPNIFIKIPTVLTKIPTFSPKMNFSPWIPGCSPLKFPHFCPKFHHFCPKFQLFPPTITAPRRTRGVQALKIPTVLTKIPTFSPKMNSSLWTPGCSPLKFPQFSPKIHHFSPKFLLFPPTITAPRRIRGVQPLKIPTV